MRLLLVLIISLLSLTFLPYAFAADNSCNKLILGYPFKDGLTADEFTERVLVSRQSVKEYLVDHRNGPWTEELKGYAAKVTAGTSLIYLSEFGPTFWKTEEFMAWAFATLQFNHDKVAYIELARSAIMLLARNQQIDGLSNFARERVRNSLMAHQLGLAAEKELRLRRILYTEKLRSLSPEQMKTVTAKLYGLLPHQDFLSLFLQLKPEEFAGKPTENSPPDAMDQHQAEIFARFQHGAIHARNTESKEFRAQSPSLNLPWEFDHNLKSVTTDRDAQNIKSDWSVVRIMRSLLREPLVRRLITRGKILGDLIDDDQIGFLSIFPEFVQIWPSALEWQVPIREFTFARPQDALYSPPLEFANEGSKVKALLTMRISRSNGRAMTKPFPDRLNCRFELTTTKQLDDPKTPLTTEQQVGLKRRIVAAVNRFNDSGGRIKVRLGNFSLNGAKNQVYVTSQGTEQTMSWIHFYAYLQNHLAWFE